MRASTKKRTVTERTDVAAKSLGRTAARSSTRSSRGAGERSATRRTAERKRPRLEAGAWIEAGLDALAAGGVGAVRVEPLAQALDVTKGSFYWHFADRRALIDAMLVSWREGRIAAIRQQTVGSGAPADTLASLAELYTRHIHVKGLAVELAIRAFARADLAAEKAVQAVDGERLRHVARLFAALGWSPADSRTRAVLLYAHLFGQSLLDTRTVPAVVRRAAIGTLIAPLPRRR